MNRSLWVDANNDCDYAKAKANLIAAAYFDIRDPRLTLAYFEGVRAQGIMPGVYAAANWFPRLSGPAFADSISAMLEIIAPRTPAEFPMVCLDIEKDDIAGYLLPALRRWRTHRPNRVTDLTIEGHKGALFSPSQVINVVAKVRYVVPQCYNGAMTQVWDSCAMSRDLTDAGFPTAHVYPFLDAAHLGNWWEGYAFTQGRLP